MIIGLESAFAELTGNIDKAMRDHLEILMIFRKAFLINRLLIRWSITHDPYKYSSAGYGS